MSQLKGRVVVVTGGSLGIGLATAKRCAAEGARVILGARGEGELEAARRSLEEVSAAGHLARRLDVAELASVEAFAAFVRSEVGGLHGLVNCAAILGPIGKTTEVDAAAFQQTIQINLLGTFFMCQAMAPLLLKEPRAKIVNYSGGGGTGPFPNYTAYAASKAAVVRFTENLARELDEDGVDANCVAPGFVATRMHQDTLSAGPGAAGEGYFASTQKQLSEGGTPPEKAADLTTFLLSAASDGITGKLISAPWDPYLEPDFHAALRADGDFATVRRIDRKNFGKV